MCVIFLLLDIYFYLHKCMCAHVGGFAYTLCVSSQKGLGIQLLVGHLTCVQGMELRYSERTVSALQHRQKSTVPVS